MKDATPRDAISSLPEYIPGRQADEVIKEFGLKEVIKLASNENPFGPSPKAVKAAEASLASSNIYPDQNHILLKEGLAKAWGLEKENFIIGNGSDEIMLLASAVYMGAGQEAVISRNTFSVYDFSVKLMDGTVKYVDLKGSKYDADAIIGAVSKDTKLVFICNPNNPTGTYLTRKEMDRLMSEVPASAVVVIDEAYGDFADSEDFPKGIDYVRNGLLNVLVLRTFSKIYGIAGLRVGYGVASKQVIKNLSTAKLPFNVNRTGQAAALAALEDKDFFTKSYMNNIEQKEKLYSGLSEMGLDFKKSQANFIYIDLKRDADEIFIGLMKKGVIVRPLASFGLKNGIRVSVGTPYQNERFLAALKEVLS